MYIYISVSVSTSVNSGIENSKLVGSEGSDEVFPSVLRQSSSAVAVQQWAQPKPQ